METAGLQGKDIISASEFSRDFIDFVHKKTDQMMDLAQEEKAVLLKGKIIALLFYEPSTRTRETFSLASITLGAKTVGFDSSSASSDAKGESLHDTIKIYEANHSDAIVIRHPREGAAKLAAEATHVPVVNAGDGQNQHPSQALIDTYAIKRTQGKIDGLKIALVGDLKYGRAVHSLFQALSQYACEIHLVSPQSLSMPRHILGGGRHFSHESLSETIKNIDLDIIYMTRVQKERFPDSMEYMKVKGSYRLTSSMLMDVKENLRILHPLPRIDEMEKDVDLSRHAAYFEQSSYGVPVRQAVLCSILGADYG